MEKKIPLRHETEKALNELYKPEKRTKPKPKDEIDEILEKSPGVSWLSPEDLEKEKVVIRKELGLEDNPKRPDDKKEKGGNA